MSDSGGTRNVMSFIPAVDCLLSATYSSRTLRAVGWRNCALEPFFEGIDFPLWVSWAAPLAALVCAGLFSFWIILQRTRVALQSLSPAPAKRLQVALSSGPIIPQSAPSKIHLESRSERPSAPNPPPPIPSPAPTGARARLRSGLFRRSERRLALRRGSEPFPVQLSDASARATPYLAHILDRSRTGLCIAVNQPVPADSILSVRSMMYADTAVWVQIRVRHCRARENQWLLGCSFVSEQPWSVLLMFG
jgi:hypothetical protein